MKTLTISFLTLSLTALVIFNAYYHKRQFYPSVVYITKSNPSMAVIYIQAFILVWILGKLMKKVFFGQLRTTEFEHLMERSWYAVTETCLAFTVFRDDFNPKFVALFTLLLFLKSFHWLAEDRVDYMERSPVIGRLFHLRCFSLLVLLASLDIHLVRHAYEATVERGASVQLVFGFEYAILLTVAANVAVKYALHSIDLNGDAPSWDNKAVFLLYTELVMGLIKVILYLAFVVIMVRIYTLPLFAFRPMYYTVRHFKKALSDVILSRRAIHNMNTLYPDATPEELQMADNVCIICREEMVSVSKKLPCNHIFHTACLRSWFQRQQTCPTCRLNILRDPTNESGNRRAQPAAAAAAQPQNNNAQQPQAPFLIAHWNHQANQGQEQQQPRVNQEQIGAQNWVFPPPMLPMFMMPPPPMPPRNLATLSMEELQRMEGNERENVEARIQCLRNIQILLDTAMVMMQQYTTLTAVTQQAPAAPSPRNNNPSFNNITGESPKVAKVTPTLNTATSPSGPDEDLEKPGTSKETEEQDEASGRRETPEEEEIRRRRLRKFQQAEGQGAN